MVNATFWLAQKLRPPNGWIAFMLVLAALLCLPLALMQAARQWQPPAAVAGLESIVVELLVLTIAAALACLIVGQSQLAGRASWVLGGGLGLALAAVLVGQLLPPFDIITADLQTGLLWLRAWQGRVIGWPLPVPGSVEYGWQQLASLGGQVVWDIQSLLQGPTFWSSTTYHLLATWAAWLIAYAATWFLYRRQLVLAGLAPSGILLTLLVFVYLGAAPYLIAYLFCTLWLEALGQLWQKKAHWEERGTDYPGSLGVELVLAATPWILVAIVLASFFPIKGFWTVSNAFWDGVEQVFGPLEGGYGGGPPRYGAMPQVHLLGGGPELGETVVLYVNTDDPPPPRPDAEPLEGPAPAIPARYWKGESFDVYTGQGWASSPVEARTIAPGQPLAGSAPARDELRQQFELVAPATAVTYAANSPLLLDRQVETWRRGPDDLAWLAYQADRYEVVSTPPEPTVDELRSAEERLPPEFAERYLALPDSVPTRVLDLAAQVSSGAESRYDQARALETFLRTYSYTLDIPTPPAGVDVVDHFLFELQAGYCDYYASAMVVMARAIGVPARFATGYAQGTYDYDAGRWVVTEKDGHSWAEVYFEGIGWVEFEATAGLPALERPRGLAAEARPMVPPIPPRAGKWWEQVPWALLLVAGGLAALAAFVSWIWLRGRQQPATAAEMVRNRHERLMRWGHRLGLPLRDGQTAHEYGAALSETLSVRGHTARWSIVRQAGAQAPDGVRELTEAFVRAQYSPDPVSGREGWRIRERWAQLRRQLWWLWLAGGPAPKDRDPRGG